MISRRVLTKIIHFALTLTIVGTALGTLGLGSTYADSTMHMTEALEQDTSLASPTIPLPTEATPPTTSVAQVATTDTVWSVETVQSGSDIGHYSSLGIDSLGHLHVGYYDHPNTALKYAQWNGSGWVTSTVDNSASVGQFPSLGLDSSNYPHISYYDLTNSALKVAHWDGSSWVRETVDNSAAVGEFTSLAVHNGDVYVSYVDTTHSALRYAHWNGSSWISETVDSSGVVIGDATSLALYGSNPRISYRNCISRTLRYAAFQGTHDGDWVTTWNISDINQPGDEGESSSIAIDSNGYEHISYSSRHVGVRYIYRDVSGWHDSLIETADSEFAIPTSLALDDEDRPHVAYVTNDGLRYATFNGVSWDIETVDGDNGAGSGSISLALDGDGYPHITYYGSDDTAAHLPANAPAVQPLTAYKVHSSGGHGETSLASPAAPNYTPPPCLRWHGRNVV